MAARINRLSFPTSPYEVALPETRWQSKDLAPFVQELRRQVHDFRKEQYKGATPTSKSLLKHWFHTKHIIGDEEFRYYFAQREALETLVYMLDVKKAKDSYDLMRLNESAPISKRMMPEEWLRYVIKMATGSGKTKVLSLVIAWCYFHKRYEENSPLARNFLIIAPNIIVLDRLYKDFQGLKIFYDDPVLPENGSDGKNWRDDFQEVKLHKQNEVSTQKKLGNIFLTNIQRIYTKSMAEPSFDDDDRKNYFMGKKLTGSATESQIKLRDVVRNIEELVVLNDEAHHIHNEDLAWATTIEDIHNSLQLKNSKLSLQIDVTATPKHSKGQVFLQTISDYPLVEAIRQNIVKHPVLPDQASRDKLEEKKTSKHVEKYKDYIDLGVAEWQKAYAEHKKMGKKAILFMMSDSTANCDDIAEYLENNYHALKGRVLSIHIGKDGNFQHTAGGVKKLEEARKRAHDIDSDKNKYRAIVSVMMLREGWDVRNVTTVVGLRPFTAESNILPEQAIGRGLRRMYKNTQEERVSVIGTKAFMKFVELVDKEGAKLLLFESMTIDSSKQNITSLIIEIDHDNKEKNLNALDIEIPILTNLSHRDYRQISQLDIDTIIFTPLPYVNMTDEAEPREIVFKYALGDQESHKTILDPSRIGNYRQVIGFFTEVMMKKVRLFRGFDDLFPKVESFVRTKLFSKEVDLNSVQTLLNLNRNNVMSLLIESFIKAINKVITQKTDRPICIEKTISLVRDVKPYRSQKEKFFLPEKSPFNKIVGDSGLETKFAEQLEELTDIASYAKNYFSVNFSIDYIGYNGEIHRYHPDFFVKLKDERIFVVELKGQEGIDARPKFDRLKQWCVDANDLSPSTPSRYHTLYLTQEACKLLSNETTFSDFAKTHKNDKPQLPSQTKSTDSQ